MWSQAKMTLSSNIKPGGQTKNEIKETDMQTKEQTNIRHDSYMYSKTKIDHIKRC